MGPLEGLKVIDLTHVMAGPTCTLMLADMGADVIKIERMPGGDDTRRSIPPTIDGESAAFMMMNRNKRGMALDLKSEGDRRVLRRLLADADVLVENYRPGTLARLGFDYEGLRRDNPGLIYCALSGFGRTGPYGHRGGFDLVAQALSGIMSITGEGPGRPPTKCGAPLTDITCGILAAMGVLAAYAHRLKTGRGQMVDTSLMEAGIVQTYWQSAIALATGIAPGPMGSAHPLTAPYQAFETADGWIVIGGSNQSNWLARSRRWKRSIWPTTRGFATTRPHGPYRGARGGARTLLQGTQQRGSAGSPRGAGRPGRPGLRRQPDAPGPPGAGAQDGDRGRAQPARPGPHHWSARQILGHAGRGLPWRAALRSAHPRGPARARLCRRRDRRAARRGRDRGLNRDARPPLSRPPGPRDWVCRGHGSWVASSPGRRSA